jgi:hypothetical protein
MPTYLHHLLTDVLAGRKQIEDRFTFDLLRQVAPDKTEQLNHLEGEAIARRTQPTMIAVERIRREMQRKSVHENPPPDSNSSKPEKPVPIKLTRADLEEILHCRRPAKLDEIEWLLAHARDYQLQLSSVEELELRNLIESDLMEVIRPHYKRVEEEGRTFIQTALQDAADLEPTQDQLRITLAPLNSPHRSRVLGALCEALNETHTKFPGTELEMQYAVAATPEGPKSGHVSKVLCQA